MTITLAITAYRETTRGNLQWIRECLAPAIAHDIVSDIWVIDDNSTDYEQLAESLDGLPKVRHATNPYNFGVFGNKLESVAGAHNEWVLMCDSDNVMGRQYLGALKSMQPWDANTWYSASFARPDFNYRSLAGRWDAHNVAQLVDLPLAECCLNTGNQFVHRDTFMDVFEQFRHQRFDLMQPDYLGVGDRSDLKWRLVYDAADSIFYNKTWILQGGTLAVCRELEYDHRRRNDSSWGIAPAEKERLPAFYLQELREANVR